MGVSEELATVAMEYSPIENDASGDKVVKFFVYKKGLVNYGPDVLANLDGRGERPVPQLCMICHGGQIPQQTGGVPTFGSAAQVKFNSRFLPFDHRFFTFPTGLPALTKANQEASIKKLNLQMVNAAPPVAVTDPIREVVRGMYSNGTSATQILNFTVPGWVNGASANVPNQAAFYRGRRRRMPRLPHRATVPAAAVQHLRQVRECLHRGHRQQPADAGDRAAAGLRRLHHAPCVADPRPLLGRVSLGCDELGPATDTLPDSIPEFRRRRGRQHLEERAVHLFHQ